MQAELARKPCSKCRTPHWTVPDRCPACHGVREAMRSRYRDDLVAGEYFSETVFQQCFGPETFLHAGKT